MASLQDNSNILRDAAHLQTQLRAFDGLVETRHAILRGRPNFRQHWIAMAVAYHLNGQLTEAKRTMEHYEAMLKVKRLSIITTKRRIFITTRSGSREA
jgi:N-alpha-acetyltransferase 15/16, NatA auxiliary subunit